MGRIVVRRSDEETPNVRRPTTPLIRRTATKYIRLSTGSEGTALERYKDDRFERDWDYPPKPGDDDYE